MLIKTARKRFTILTPIFSTLILGVMVLFSHMTMASEPLSTGWLTNPNHPPAKVNVMFTGEVDKNTNTLNAVIDVELDNEWKTYWRTPGEGGISPSLAWQASSNVAAINWLWPIPKYYEQLGLMTLGYKHEVVYPLQVQVDDLNTATKVEGVLTLPTCTDICVLTDYPFSLDLPPANQLNTNSDTFFLYQKALSKVPVSSNQTKVEAASFDKNSQKLQVKLTNDKVWENPQILIDGKDVEDDSFLQPDIKIEGTELTATFAVTNWLGEAELVGKNVQITVSDNQFNRELSAQIDGAPFVIQKDSSIIKLLFFALIGGLILNVMPCVLPVIGLKINTILLNNNKSSRLVRMQFLASAAGIIFSFWLLSAGLIAIKLTGNVIGWGIQFQSPIFLAFMLIITVLFTANLFGIFEIQLPGRFSTSIANKGGDSVVGYFVQGMFATLLATPCSAPFLGTAVGFALTSNILTMFAIFTFLGLGMALPWLLLAIFPKSIAILPKPGAWMNKVKLFFGLMMFATTLWLLSLLTIHIGTAATIGLLVALIVIFFGLLIKKQGVRAAAILFSSLVLIGGCGFFVASMTSEHWSTPIVDELEWQPLQEQSIQQYVAEGKTVFVDVTADWCITCKANKLGVILQDPVNSRLQDQNMILMKGDWTRPSEKITNFLKKHNSAGVPLNIVYGPKYPNGITLPVILTDKDVLTAIDRVNPNFGQ
ncbi:thioredoxin family protein [Vibrio sp. SS-MA-C1-2]|uniref:protein-disulfide reductase DsbD family protein n=1 Tax=Vibrio sp. SS-MA-C1-2 TaxID=2908646 RepID=UPI001F22F071|nr:protein-disulfide reductase DsbD domain-containing protein [Vibrio sp. SS-MA-C1-2]UJF18237.1 thioredoxin family protein [Vibrio sp. SS-MA-C1-2]